MDREAGARDRAEDRAHEAGEALNASGDEIARLRARVKDLEERCEHLRWAAKSALDSAQHWRQVSVRDRRERNNAVRNAVEDRYSDDVLSAVLHGLADRPDLDVSAIDRHRMRVAADRLMEGDHG